MSSQVHASFRIISIIAFAWNLTGVTMFLMQMQVTPEQIAAMPEAQRVVYEAMPSWLAIFYGLGVFGGAFGALGLLLRRRWAMPLFAISLAAVIVQMAAIYAVTPAWEVSGASSLPMTLLIVGIAAFLLWYARHASRRGWLR